MEPFFARALPSAPPLLAADCSPSHRNPGVTSWGWVRCPPQLWEVAFVPGAKTDQSVLRGMAVLEARGRAEAEADSLGSGR